ncbi:LysR family transcriptional regulator [Ramlibacter montanisoli]|uniref:LysR family transcriptional regulator n=1 Tax=Ramlibacter montanisoli TaxID=2732512 RepID=A0A849K950_9BURK|nr:LysR family transcriptional regulator [Ramlibacter montanisoli]NNU42016.1 LysR family transcriptional regulator [Ramlibacter montanisoli]
MDRFFAMSAFVRVVEAGSFTKASETMDLPKPTVTRLIQGLERELRVRLLDRTTRSVTVTAEGATYYERVVRLLADLSDIESTAKQSIARPSGRLRVDVATAIATSVLIPALPEFYRSYPEIELDLGITNRYVDLVADNVDCAVRVGAVEEQFVVARRVGEFRFVTCASPGYLSAFGTPAAPGDLDGKHRLLGLVSTRTGKAIPFRFQRRAEDIEIAPHPRLSVDDTNAYLAAGLAGLGILQAPAYMVEPAMRAGQLVAVLQDWTTPAVPVHVLYRPNRFLGAKVRVFIDWTVALFERNHHLKLD